MPNTYTLLETITVGAAGAASVTFNSIPQTGYTDLVIKVSARTTEGTIYSSLDLQFNGLGNANHSSREITGNGASVSTSTVNYLGYANGAGSTANTFASFDIYIPNYRSSNFKSYSTDATSENNATTAYATFHAGLWSNTAAISSVTLIASAGTSVPFTQHSTFSLYGVSALGVTPTRAPKATGGSIIQTDGTYWYHAFLSSGTFTPATGLSCDYLVVAGGGGGGQYVGGGGAGGLRSTVTATGGGGTLETALSLTGGTTYTVTIGAGGVGATNSPSAGTSGSNSVFSTITSTGGGRGDNGSNTAGAGGSGGGGGAAGGTTPAGVGTANQGYNGGNNATFTTGPYPAGGGGGAGGVGGSATSLSVSGNGGAGVTISAFATATGTGVSNSYAGGGGGGIFSGGGTGGTATAGGGAGNGAETGTAGTANTGGGGGGGIQNRGGAGGSGVVIVRYLA